MYFDCVKRIFPTEVRFKVYADDLKVYAPVRSVDEHGVLQRAADDFLAWTRKMSLQVSTQKCCVFHYGRGNAKFQYTLDGVTLVARSEIKDLGIHITEKLDFESHATHVLKKTAQITNWIMRAVTLKRPEPYLKMYRSVVLPITTYASPVWSPRFCKDVKRLQTAQNRFLRRVETRTGQSGLSVEFVADRLRRTDLKYLTRLKKNPARFATLFNQRSTNTRSGATISPKATARSEKVRHLYPWRVTDVYSEN